MNKEFDLMKSSFFKDIGRQIESARNTVSFLIGSILGVIGTSLIIRFSNPFEAYGFDFVLFSLNNILIDLGIILFLGLTSAILIRIKRKRIDNQILENKYQILDKGSQLIQELNNRGIPRDNFHLNTIASHLLVIQKAANNKDNDEEAVPKKSIVYLFDPKWSNVCGLSYSIDKAINSNQKSYVDELFEKTLSYEPK